MKKTDVIVKILKADKGILVFDKDRTFMYEGEEPLGLMDMLNGKHKTYCQAQIQENEDGEFFFHILKELPDETW